MPQPTKAELIDFFAREFPQSKVAVEEIGHRSARISHPVGMDQLRPGGTVAILEFTEPPPGLMGDLYRWYFRNVLPRIGALLSGDGKAYSYLPASVSRFFRPAELAALMSAVGYQSTEFKVWTFGTVALHLGVRPPR